MQATVRDIAKVRGHDIRFLRGLHLRPEVGVKVVGVQADSHLYFIP